MGIKKGCLDLEKEVLNEGLCTSCGACVGLCPYIKVASDKVAVVEPCNIEKGQCYEICPRTSTDVSALNQNVFGKKRSDFSLGSYISVEIAQAKDKKIRNKAQYGGVVSALIKQSLDSGYTGVSVLTKPFNGSIMPSRRIIEQSSQVLECAGSNFIPAATLSALNYVARQHKGDIGIVGIPCQIVALRKMQNTKHENGSRRVKLAIGLFCTWALSYKEFNRFLKNKIDPLAIQRIDIPPPPANKLVTYSASGSAEFSLNEVRKLVKPTCGICYDMTSEFADISVGMVEGMEDWNTLIVRTEEAAKFVAKAKEDGVIETKTLDKERLSHLREASSLKKRRAISEIVKRTGDDNNLLYLLLDDKERKSYL